MQRIPLKVELDSVREPNRFRTKISPPYFYLSHGIKPIILRGKLDQWNANETVSSSSDYFVEAVPTGSKSFALRAYSLQEKGYELAKKNSTEPFEFKFDLLEKQIDGLFDVDGQLLFNKETSTLVYLHYYKNQYLVMDTSLNLKFKANTIDTFSHARIKVSKIKSEAQSMVSSPQMQLNQRGYLYKNLLLVQSNLLSATESAESFLINSIFDIYDISNGTYVKSLYIPDYKGHKVTDMLITDDKIITISGSHLITYDHDEKILAAAND